MAQQGKFIPPTYGPDVLARQLKMMQDSERAKAQVEQGMQPLQGQMVSGHYIAPHWSQQLAQGLNRYQGERTMQQLPEQMAELQNMQQQQMMGQFGFGQPSPQALAAGLGGEQPQPGMSGDTGGVPQQGQGPMLLPGLSEQQSMMALQTLGPQKYMQVYQEQFKPTNEQRNLSHLPANQRNQLLEAGAMQDATRDGVQMIRGADGQIYSVPVQGYAQSQAALQGGITGAQEGARAMYDLVEVPDGQGGMQMMPRDQAVQMLGGGASGQPGGQQIQAGAPGQQQDPTLGRTLPDPTNVREQREFQKQIQGDISKGQRTMNMVDRNINYIDRLLENEDGLRGIVGRAAQFKPTLMMLDSELEANADIDTIKSKVVLQTMEEMRASSAAGATGFGNMNQAQLKVIQDSLGSLERATTGDQIIENLKIIRNTFEQMRNNAIQEFDAEVQQYGQYLGREYQPGEFGQARPTQTPSEISGRANRPALTDIFGG